MNLRRILLTGAAAAAVLVTGLAGYAAAAPGPTDTPTETGVDLGIVEAARTEQGDGYQRVTVLRLNYCANSVSVIGFLNPAYDTTCTPE